MDGREGEERREGGRENLGRWGTYAFPDGRVYSGGWDNGMRHGGGLEFAAGFCWLASYDRWSTNII